MSCILPPASLVRVMYSFGWHRTSFPAIVSPGFIRLVAFSALQTILSAFGACTVQNLSVTRPHPHPFKVCCSVTVLFAKVTELPTFGSNKQSLSGTFNRLALPLIRAPLHALILRTAPKLSVKIYAALVDTVPWRVVEIKLSI